MGFFFFILCFQEALQRHRDMLRADQARQSEERKKQLAAQEAATARRQQVLMAEAARALGFGGPTFE